MMGKFKLNIYNLLTYAMIFAIVKPHFLPDWLRQGSKILILVCIFLFILSKTPKENLLNVSVLFSGTVLVSASLAFLRGNYQTRDFLDAVLYGITFYDIYSFVGLCKRKNHFSEMLRCLYNITMLYCFMTLVSVMLVGVSNNSNHSIYVFGNKFTSSYLFILLTALYGIVYNTKMRRYHLCHLIFFAVSIVFTYYIGCATATVSLVILLAIVLFSTDNIKLILLNEKIITGIMIASGLVVIWMAPILNIDFVKNIVYGFFDKTVTVSGRLEIYSVYLMDIIKERFWFGYGYSNSVIRNLSGLYSNAQNGLMEIMVNVGFLGVLSLLFTVFYCFKKTSKTLTSFSMAILVYGMVIAAVFEVSLNWFFLLGICLIRWNCELEKEN